MHVIQRRRPAGSVVLQHLPSHIHARRLCRPAPRRTAMSTPHSSASSSAMPAYGLNAQLTEDTPEPPVPMAKAWAASYPSPSSPFARKERDDPIQPLLNLAQGVPGHEPHASLLRRMAQQHDARPMDTHGYGGVFGDEGLREALAADIRRVYGGDVGTREVAITAGANLAAAVTFHALAAPGQSVVLPTPWYFNHQMTLASLGINVVPLDAPAPTFRPSLAAFEDLLKSNPSIKALVLVTPNNPTGSIYPPALIEQFAKTCRASKVALILDETYRDFLLQGDGEEQSGEVDLTEERPLLRPHELFARTDLAWRDTVISLHSFSKSYAIPGHRLGAIVAHPGLLISQAHDADGQAITRFGSFAKSLDNMQICPPRTDTQRAVAACIGDVEHQRWRTQIANDLRARRNTFLQHALRQDRLTFTATLDKLGIQAQAEEVRSLCGVKEDGGSEEKAASPTDVGWKGLSAGAYYAYVRHPFDDVPSESVARGLALLVGVVVLPGSFFRPGSEAKYDRDLRFSIANVESARLDTLAARLLLFTRLWKHNGAGWGL